MVCSDARATRASQFTGQALLLVKRGFSRVYVDLCNARDPTGALEVHPSNSEVTRLVLQHVVTCRIPWSEANFSFVALRPL